MALQDAHPNDAAAICMAFLEGLETGGPNTDPFGTVYSSAAIWADSAPIHEVVAYGVAALDALRGEAAGIGTRKRLFASLWQTFSDEDRKSFLSRVDPDGKLRGPK